jgi:FKBP-type peptidyl-prolyl cis-trans isomerase SlpA
MSNVMINSDSKVTLHFALKFEDGDVIDSTFEKEAATFVMGDGSLLLGFEKKLLGLTVGAKESFTVLPEEGFGQPNPNNVQQFARSDFADDMELAEGMVVSFADASQSELPGVVKKFDSQQVEVDFNHPLAGRNIIFDVEIVDIETA